MEHFKETGGRSFSIASCTMSGNIYDPQRLLIVKRKMEGRKREEQGEEMLNHFNAEDTQTLKGTADLTMLLPISRIKEWTKSIQSIIKSFLFRSKLT